MLSVIRKTKQFLPQKEIASDLGLSVKSVGVFQNEVRCAEMKRVAIDEPITVSEGKVQVDETLLYTKTLKNPRAKPVWCQMIRVPDNNDKTSKIQIYHSESRSAETMSTMILDRLDLSQERPWFDLERDSWPAHKKMALNQQPGMDIVDYACVQNDKSGYVQFKTDPRNPEKIVKVHNNGIEGENNALKMKLRRANSIPLHRIPSRTNEHVHDKDLAAPQSSKHKALATLSTMNRKPSPLIVPNTMSISTFHPWQD